MFESTNTNTGFVNSGGVVGEFWFILVRTTNGFVGDMESKCLSPPIQIRVL